MKKNGFTLIELLAVIAILAIIAIIAVPIILNVIEKSKKGAAESSAYGYIDAVEKYAALNGIDKTKYPYTLRNNTYNVTNEVDGVPGLNTFIELKGDKPSKGTIVLNKKGQVTSTELIINEYKVVCLNDKCSSDGKYELITLTYNLNGGTLDRVTEDIEKGKSFTLPTPVKDGYDFLGWYTEATFKNKVTNPSTFTTDTELYANWKVAPKLVTSITNPWTYGKYYKLKNGDLFISTNTNKLLVMIGYKSANTWDSAATKTQQYNSNLNSRLMTYAEAKAMDGTNIGASIKRASTYKNGIFSANADGSCAHCSSAKYVCPCWWLSDANNSGYHAFVQPDGSLRYVDGYGGVYNSNYYLIRPVITLPNDATYLSGTGTSSDPYMINNY